MRTIIIKTDFEIFQQQEVKITKKQKKIMEDDMDRISKVLNQSINYLSNCREVALLGVKGGKPTFNSKYDTGLYKYPIQNTKGKRHPTQKNLKLFEELIHKHSNEGNLVVDPFLGSGTTALACKNTNRKFSGCEIDENYYKMCLEKVK